MYLNDPLAAGVSTIPTPISPVYNQEMERERFIRSGGRIDQSWFCSNGQLAREEWSLDDKLHREDGPAQTLWYEDGTIKTNNWFLDGRRVSIDEFRDYVHSRDTGMTHEMAKAWVGI